MLLVEKKTTVGARMRKSTTIRRFFLLFFNGWSIHFKTWPGLVKFFSAASIYSFLSSGVLYLSFLILAIISISSLGSINFFLTRRVTSASWAKLLDKQSSSYVISFHLPSKNIFRATFFSFSSKAYFLFPNLSTGQLTQMRLKFEDPADNTSFMLPVL